MEFSTLLQTLMSTDNTARKQAEQYFSTSLSSNPIGGLQQLISYFSSAENDMVLRSFAGVLLRRAIDQHSKAIAPEMLAQLREALINMWVTEKESILLMRLSHAIAQSATTTGGWDDLIPTVVGQAGSLDAKGMVALLGLIERIAEYCPEDIQKQVGHLGSFLATCLSATAPDVQVACARATGAVINAIEDETIRSQFRPALTPILTVLGGTLERGDELDATKIMDHLIEIAQMQPLFFKTNMDAVVACMISVASSEGLDFSTRSIALELMVTLTESAPAMARRCQGLIQGLVPLAFELMLDIDEEDTVWAQGKYGDDSTEDNHLVGEEAIERAAAGMGGRVLAPAVFQLAQTAGSSTEWRRRRAAVVAIMRLAEGAVEVFKPHLPNALNYLETSLGDASPYVQYEAVQAIGQFSLLFPQAVAQMVTRFVPLLTMGVKNTDMCPRVRGHCANAMINIASPGTCDADMLQPHLPALLDALLSALQNAPVEVQGPCLVLLGFVAQVSEDAFVPFYPSFMPGVKAILANACQPGLEELRGKAMECAGLIGEAVGETVFAPDALEVMQTMIGAMQSSDGKFGDNDITFDYILPACSSISKALGANFVPFLPYVMDPLLAAATKIISIVIEDANEEDADADLERDEDTGMDTTVVNFAGVFKRVSLNTHAVQQKKKAVDMLYTFASSLKSHLGSYLVPSLEALLPCVLDKNSAETRSSASMSLSSVFEAFVDATKLGQVSPADTHKVMEEIMAKLLVGLQGESSVDARAAAAEALRDLLHACFESGPLGDDGSRDSKSVLCKPSLEVAQQASNILLELSGESIARRAEKETEFESSEVLEDEDRGSIEEDIAMEEELLTNLVDGIGQFIKLHGEDFMPHFNTAIAPKFAPFLAPTQPKPLQVIAVCMIDDAIEFGGAQMHHYLPQSLPILLQNMKCDHATLRQSSAYGIAQMCNKAPDFAVTQMHNITTALVDLTQRADAKEEDNEGATDNALFALGCLLFSKNPTLKDPAAWSGINRSGIGELWLKGLPLTADENQAVCAAHQLCNAIEAMDTDIVGPSMSRLADVVRALAEVLLSSCATPSSSSSLAATPATVQRMRQITIQLRGMVSADVWSSVASQMSPKLQAVLQAV